MDVLTSCLVKSSIQQDNCRWSDAFWVYRSQAWARNSNVERGTNTHPLGAALYCCSCFCQVLVRPLKLTYICKSTKTNCSPCSILYSSLFSLNLFMHKWSVYGSPCYMHGTELKQNVIKNNVITPCHTSRAQCSGNHSDMKWEQLKDGCSSTRVEYHEPSSLV